MININNKFKIHRIFSALFSLICMVTIFCFSSEDSDKSTKTSNTYVNYAVEHFVKDFDNLPKKKQVEIIDKTSFSVRKTAHFLIYTALGLFVSFTAGKRKAISPATALTLLICFLYACTDELHQYFIPGRSSQFTDVLIDTAGSLAGIFISLLIMRIVLKYKNKRSCKPRNIGNAT